MMLKHEVSYTGSALGAAQLYPPPAAYLPLLEMVGCSSLSPIGTEKKKNVVLAFIKKKTKKKNGNNIFLNHCRVSGFVPFLTMRIYLFSYVEL